MSERYWSRRTPRAAALTALLAGAGTAAITGCGSAGSNGAAASGSASPSSAGMAAVQGTGTASYTATQLRGALLAKINGVSADGPAQSGAYGTLPDVEASKRSMQGVSVKPAKCADASATGFNSATFAASPASVVTFRIGGNGVSEVIVRASPSSAAQALAAKLPNGCAHYHATVEGRTFAYTVKEAPVSGIAEQARALNVKAAGYADVDVWSVVYRANGFVGAVTIVGPDASEAGVKILASQAYARAAASLH